MLYVHWPPRWGDDDDDDDFIHGKEPAVPKHRYSKIIRFVPGEQIDNLLTSYDPDKNILRINKEIYDLLEDKVRLPLWRLTSNTELTYPNVVKTRK